MHDVVVVAGGGVVVSSAVVQRRSSWWSRPGRVRAGRSCSARVGPDVVSRAAVGTFTDASVTPVRARAGPRRRRGRRARGRRGGPGRRGLALDRDGHRAAAGLTLGGEPGPGSAGPEQAGAPPRPGRPRPARPASLGGVSAAGSTHRRRTPAQRRGGPTQPRLLFMSILPRSRLRRRCPRQRKRRRADRLAVARRARAGPSTWARMGASRGCEGRERREQHALRAHDRGRQVRPRRDRRPSAGRWAGRRASWRPGPAWATGTSAPVGTTLSTRSWPRTTSGSTSSPGSGTSA